MRLRLIALLAVIALVAGIVAIVLTGSFSAPMTGRP
jgi:hypothetical protein